MRELVIDRLIGFKTFDIDWSGGLDSAAASYDLQDAAYRAKLGKLSDDELLRMLIDETIQEQERNR
jgi:hypothetical protein